MKKQWLIFLVISFLGLASGPVFAEEVKQSLKSQEELLRVTGHDQNRRLEELERSLTNLGRRMDRLDDRFEMLDRDLKDLKRKV